MKALAHCLGTTKAGRPCRRWPGRDTNPSGQRSPYCAVHDPVGLYTECVGGPGDGRWFLHENRHVRTWLAVRRPDEPTYWFEPMPPLSATPRPAHLPDNPFAGLWDVLGRYELRYREGVPYWAWVRTPGWIWQEAPDALADYTPAWRDAEPHRPGTGRGSGMAPDRPPRGTP